MYGLCVFGLLLIWQNCIHPVFNGNDEISTSSTAPTILEQEEAVSTQPESIICVPDISYNCNISIIPTDFEPGSVNHTQPENTFQCYPISGLTVSNILQTIRQQQGYFMQAVNFGFNSYPPYFYGQQLRNLRQKYLKQNEPSGNAAQSMSTDFIPRSLQDYSNFVRQSSSSKSTTCRRKSGGCLRKKSVSGYKKYSDFDMRSAVEAVLNGMPVSQSAIKYKVPQRSLYMKLSEYKSATSTCASSASTSFSHSIMSTPEPQSGVLDASNSRYTSNQALVTESPEEVESKTDDSQCSETDRNLEREEPQVLDLSMPKRHQSREEVKSQVTLTAAPSCSKNCSQTDAG